MAMEAASAPLPTFSISSHSLLPSLSHSSSSPPHAVHAKFHKVLSLHSIPHRPNISLPRTFNPLLNNQRSGALCRPHWMSGGRRIRTSPSIVAEYQRESVRSSGKVDTEKEAVEQEEKSIELEQAINELQGQKESFEESFDVEKSYEEPAEAPIGVLKDTTEELREQAEKARTVLAALELETTEKTNSPVVADATLEPGKDIAGAASLMDSAAVPPKAAKIHDFCLGIPYGGLLVAGGLLSFVLTGRKAAIRFGVILGGLILFLSVTSLKVWKKGESSMPFIKAQAAIASILFIREVRRFLEMKAFYPSVPMALMSGAMLGFYGYVYFSGGNPLKKSKVEPSAQGA